MDEHDDDLELEVDEEAGVELEEYRIDDDEESSDDLITIDEDADEQDPSEL